MPYHVTIWIFHICSYRYSVCAWVWSVGLLAFLGCSCCIFLVQPRCQEEFPTTMPWTSCRIFANFARRFRLSPSNPGKHPILASITANSPHHLTVYHHPLSIQFTSPPPLLPPLTMISTLTPTISLQHLPSGLIRCFGSTSLGRVERCRGAQIICSTLWVAKGRRCLVGWWGDSDAGGFGYGKMMEMLRVFLEGS